MRRETGQRVCAAIALFLLLASCGPSPQAGGGIGGTGNTASVASGPITGFGSVFVSGYEYDTATTAMTVDGKPGSQSDLKKGMVVLVNATLTHNYGTNDPPQRTAKRLLYEDTVEGVVQSVAQDGSSLVVLGQTVAITTTTIIDDTIPGQNVLSLVPGRSLVEVSGFVTGDGTIVGTFVELKSIDPKTATPDYEVKGFIKHHDITRKTFEIGSLTVDYRDADLKDMQRQSSNIWNGLLVDVRGNQASSGGSGSYGVRLTANRVKPEGLGSTDSEATEVEGFVTQMLGPGDFFIGNVHVQTSADTTFEGGTLNDILDGARLEVQGPLVGGIVNATKVEFEGEAELRANVATIDSNDNTVTLIGLAGLVIKFDGKTALHGQGNPRRLTDLHRGDHLQIHGRLHGENTVLAKEVERSDPTSNVQIQGLVMSTADPLLVLFGSSIDTSSIPENGFLGRYGILGRSAFFKSLSSGRKIALRGTYQPDIVSWSSASRGD
ncbi:MAG: hypothetical protein CAF45_000890 [Nitrospira sp. CG24E]|nr:MAG: hypothetical protein CAF45_000890 [Nitrospira sp. CG24E]